ncbi:MAG: helix-turn-helix domain-containing protein [Woeseiaceae bacterium]|nr:helix-turn-helix domain-containing protein [Woeseiaceae bacterium]
MKEKRSSDQAERYQISDLDQVKALAHPLRLRILETLVASEPMTTKQVAEKLGEKPTRLYHHVDKLEKVGLIRLTHTRQIRGATEKYYEAVARSFAAGAELFSDESTEEQESALVPMIRTVFDNTTNELMRLVASNSSANLIEEEGIMSYLEMHLTQAQVDELQQKLKDVLDHVQGFEDSEETREDDLRKYRLTLAYYPLDRFD